MPDNSRTLHLFAAVWILLISLIPVVSAGNVSNGSDDLKISEIATVK